MKRIRKIISLGLVGGLALMVGTSTVQASGSNSWVNSDYIIEDDSQKFRTQTRYEFTDEECVDNETGTKIKGRIVNAYERKIDNATGEYVSEWTFAGQRQYYPASIKDLDGNLSTSLTSFLDEYIEKSQVTSENSFYSYIDYLVKDYGMSDEDAKNYCYKWRETHNSLTDEEKEAVEKAKAEEQARQEEYEKRKQEELENILNYLQNSSDDEVTEYDKEADMIERNTPSFYNFDREKFISLRKQGESYLDAYNDSINIDYAEGFKYAADKMKEKADWYKQMYDTFTSDSFMETFQGIANDLGNFFGELFGSSGGASNSGTTTTTETGESD